MAAKEIEQLFLTVRKQKSKTIMATDTPKKGMGAYRLPKETLDTLKTVSEKTGIPTSTIVARCLEKQKVLDVVREHLAKATKALAE